MTTIVAVETPGGVTFASDSRVSGSTINDGWVSKVVTNGGITFGAAGHLRAIQLLQHAKFAEPTPHMPDSEVDRYVSTELVPAIAKAFREAGSDQARTQSIILLAVHGRVYEVVGDGAWVRSANGFYAVGSGASLALGALSAGASPTEAVRIASLYDGATNSDVKELKVDKYGHTVR